MPTWASASMAMPIASKRRPASSRSVPTDADDELVAAVADDRIERPQPSPHRAHDRLQHAVAGGMTVAIVHDLEPVDVDEGHDEPAVRAARPVDLVRQGQPADLAPVDAGQLVEMGRAQLGLEPGTFAGRVRPIEGGALSIRRGSRTVGGRLRPNHLELLFQGCLRIQRGCAPARPRGHHGPGRPVARLRDAIAVRGRQIAIGRRQVAIGGRGRALESVPQSLDRRRLALATRRVVGFVGTGRSVSVGDVIAVGGRLVAVRCALIPDGCAVVRIRGGLVAVSRGLIRVGRRLVRIGPHLVRVASGLGMERIGFIWPCRFAGGSRAVTVSIVHGHPSSTGRARVRPTRHAFVHLPRSDRTPMRTAAHR